MNLLKSIHTFIINKIIEDIITMEEYIAEYQESQPVKRRQKPLSEEAKMSRRANMEKARQTRLKNQEEQRKIVEKYREIIQQSDEAERETDSSESEEEVITYNKKPKVKAKKEVAMQSIGYLAERDKALRLRKLEAQVKALELTKEKKGKGSAPLRKTIYVETQGPEKVVEKIVEKKVLQKDQMLDHMRKKIVNF